MFVGCKQPDRLILDPNAVPEPGPVFVNQGRFQDTQVPIWSTFAPEVLPESGSLLVNQLNQFSLIPEPLLILDSNVIQASSPLFVNQLDGLREHHRGVTRTLRTLTQDLQAVELIESAANGLLQGSGLAATAQSKFAHLSGNEPNCCVPSLHPCMGFAGIGSFQQDLCAYVVSIVRCSRNVLQRRVLECKRELRRTRTLIGTIEKAVFFAVSFFCSVPWERRRWFLHHGARPPKQTVQAILSLFTGACSGSLIAY
jgi:hypothetical protein